MLGNVRCVTWSCLLTLLAWLAAPSVHAEGVEERATVPSSTIRLRGAAGIGAIPGGYISVGGSRLQFLEGSSKRWRTLHQVQGDNLYRVEADDDGRLLASWEQERVFHLFQPATGTHERFPWPVSDMKGLNAGLQGLFFSTDGRHALVYMSGRVMGRSPDINEAYLVPLDRSGPPRRLFRFEGQRWHASPRGATFDQLVTHRANRRQVEGVGWCREAEEGPDGWSRG